MNNLIDDVLISSPIQIALCRSKKEYYKMLKSFKVPKSIIPTFVDKGKDAMIHFFESETKQLVTVCIDKELCKHYDIRQVYSMLVHETVHIFQEIKEIIGEDKPSSEFEAYSIQQMAQNLMYKYDEV